MVGKLDEKSHLEKGVYGKVSNILILMRLIFMKYYSSDDSEDEIGRKIYIKERDPHYLNDLKEIEAKNAQHTKEVKKIENYNRQHHVKREIPPALTEKQLADYAMKQKGYKAGFYERQRAEERRQAPKPNELKDSWMSTFLT